MAYDEQFNKQLSQQLQTWRKSQPNHIPVYMMKYQNASQYLIEDLPSPLNLYPKKYKLQGLHDLISKISEEHCQKTFKDQKKINEETFKVDFFLYTIKILQGKDQKGVFVKLDNQMTIQRAYELYGRQNCLTIVYTDAVDIGKTSKTARRLGVIEKWLYIVAAIIFFLVLIPCFFGGEQSAQVTTNSFQDFQKQFNSNVSNFEE